MALPGGHHLILGGCGFIARSVAITLASTGAGVVLADRRPPARPIPAEYADRIVWTKFDLAADTPAPLLDGADVVHHYAWTSIPATAALDPARDLAENVRPTVLLLEALRQLAHPPRLVFSSSGGTIYGNTRRMPVSEAHPVQPITAYGVGKAAAELYIGQYRTLHGLDCRIARLGNPFGAGQDPSRGQGAATTFAHKALRGEPIQIWGDGEVVRDYIHISDAAAGLVALAGAPRPDGDAVFNLGSGAGTSLNGIVAELQARLGRTIPVEYAPARDFDVPVNILDIGRARTMLGWAPALSFSDGLARMLAGLQAMDGQAVWTID